MADSVGRLSVDLVLAPALRTLMDRALEENEALRAEVRRLQAALVRWGAHEWDCQRVLCPTQEAPCTCGFVEQSLGLSP